MRSPCPGIPKAFACAYDVEVSKSRGQTFPRYISGVRQPCVPSGLSVSQQQSAHLFRHEGGCCRCPCMLADVALARVKDRSTSINKSASACCDILEAPVSAYNHIYHLAEQLHTVLLCGEDFQFMIALGVAYFQRLQAHSVPEHQQQCSQQACECDIRAIATVWVATAQRPKPHTSHGVMRGRLRNQAL